ncbi:MAG: hypothetical protein WC306_04060, partial [Candidatus Paceibacterota bacterium]
SITKITTARIDKERLERRLGITQAFVDKCQKLADDGFDIVVCGKNFESEPELSKLFELSELSELPILTESEVKVLRQISKEIFELQKQTDKVFTTFNKPDGTIISYIKPAKPTESVNINTDINSVKIDNTEDAAQTENKVK